MTPLSRADPGSVTNRATRHSGPPHRHTKKGRLQGDLRSYGDEEALLAKKRQAMRKMGKWYAKEQAKTKKARATA